jgi:hypothetical protein
MLDQMPMMAEPGRWRTMLYEVFWLGKEPTLTAEERKAAAQRKTEETRKMIGTPLKRSELDAMQAMIQRAQELRGEKN